MTTPRRLTRREIHPDAFTAQSRYDLEPRQIAQVPEWALRALSWNPENLCGFADPGCDAMGDYAEPGSREDGLAAAQRYAGWGRVIAPDRYNLLVGFVFELAGRTASSRPHLRLQTWWVHPRKGVLRCIEFEPLYAGDLPDIHAFLLEARDHLRAQFDHLPPF